MKQQPGIYLGYPFDQLFDRNCDLEYWKEPDADRKRTFIPAIKLPGDHHPGTGNIVIAGPPGSGKSTLALQWAVKCGFRTDNSSNAAYLSLEHTVDEVISKAQPFGWHRWLRPVRLLNTAEDLDNPDESIKSLRDLLIGRVQAHEPLKAIQKRMKEAKRKPEETDSADDGGDFTRRVLLFSLSPRPLVDGARHEDLFWRRYQQLERLLSAAHRLSNTDLKSAGQEWDDFKTVLQCKKNARRNSSQYPPEFPIPGRTILPLVVVDSLNMFGTRPLGREEIFRLFSLLRKYHRTGIFVVESTQETPFDSTMADVVISLSSQKDRGYFVQYFEVEKSRYYNQVNGLHPYKPASLPIKEDEVKHLIPPMPTPVEQEPKPPKKGIIVFPSLHYVVLRTELPEKIWRAREPLDEPERFGISAFQTILPTLPRQSVVTIEGPSGTYKTNFALNFLATGLHKGESALLIRLSDIPLLQQEDRKSNRRSLPRVSQELVEGFSTFSAEDLAGLPSLARRLLRGADPVSQCIRASLSPATMHALEERSRSHSDPTLLKSALAEEFNKLEPAQLIAAVQDHPAIKLRAETKQLLSQMQQGQALLRLRRLLLEDAYPKKIQRFQSFLWSNWALWTGDEAKEGRWCNLAGRHKTTINVWRKLTQRNSFRKGQPPPEPTLFELDFKGGALLPEEFVGIIRDILNRRTKQDGQQIRRVVLDDVGQIGVSYPFLRQSLTTGDTFLSAFVHTMRNAGVDLVMVATTTGLAQADEMVTRACSLADAVLSCSFCDVFGERHVTVRRKGLLAGKTVGHQSAQSREPVPGVIRLSDGQGNTPDTFHVDQDYLAGLVGFESGHIHRPGLLLHVFEGNKTIHGQYNQEITAMLRAGLASGSATDKLHQVPEAMRVDTVAFDAAQSEAIHGAISSFHGQEKPLDRTVLFTVDEFGAPIEDPHSVSEQWVPVSPGQTLNWKDFLLSKDSFAQPQEQSGWPGYFWPYYSNVLLLAYRKDALRRREARDRFKRPQAQSWTKLKKFAMDLFYHTKHVPKDPDYPLAVNSLPPINRAFWVDLSAAESLACLLLDALLSANGSGDFKFLTQSREGRKLRKAERTEVNALGDLLRQTGTWSPRNEPTLLDDAGVYVCWYSQLRELIERRPALATKLDVCPLPGGGFRGDWFAGIVRGSVSPALGRRIIQILCGQEEDHKRYVRGVGLPTRHLFYKPEFYAWPRSSHVTMADIRPIWQAAARRGQIGGKGSYERIRSDIFAVARQLTPLAGPVSGPFYPDDKELIDIVNVERLFAQVRLLLQSSATGK